MDPGDRVTWRLMLAASVVGVMLTGAGVFVSCGVEPHRPSLEDVAPIIGVSSFPRPSGVGETP